MIWESTKKRLAEIQTVMGKADLTGEDKTIVELPAQYAPDWTPGETYAAGRVVAYKGIKYLIINGITAQAHYPPDMENGAMLAAYKPYQQPYDCEWMYGEYCEIGYTRWDGGVLYRAFADPGANIYRPSMVPAVWEVADV